MKNFKVLFTENRLTNNAGLVLLGKFCEKLSLKNVIEQHISIERPSNSRYSIADLIMIMIIGVISGTKHVSHLTVIRNDAVIRTLFGWNRFPSNRTVGNLLRLFNQRHCNELFEVEAIVRDKVWSLKWYGRITLDLDSTVKGVYGSQSGAERGYNPKKKGQKSYHPLLCFIAENRECLHNWFRSGSSYTGNGSTEFMKECFAKKPKHVWKTYVRADSGFFSGDLLNFLEQNKAEYLIKVKMKNLKQLLANQSWRKAANKMDIATADFKHKCHKWKTSRRFVAIRKLVELRTEGLLFPMPKYEYFCYVTNCNITPLKAHQNYGKRSTSENWIEWCKNQMYAGNILTQEFWANSAAFQSCIIAYNLMVWMMWLNSKQKSFKEEPNTIRSWLINVPARLIYSGRRWSLKLPKEYIFKERWEYIEESIKSLKTG